MPNSTLITQRFFDVATDIAWLRKHRNLEIILMSSGALAWGRVGLANQGIDPTDITPQIAGAIGQIGIAAAWATAFEKAGLLVGQYLLDAGAGKSALVTSNIDIMLRKGIVPYINENIPIMDNYNNDGLSAEIAQALGCKTLILLSDIDGVYTANPTTNSDAKFIPTITNIDDAIQRFGGGATSTVGTGGMLTKLLAAKEMKTIGVETIIASGITPHPLRAVYNEGMGTRIN